jgi:hypothetical protein
VCYGFRSTPTGYIDRGWLEGKASDASCYRYLVLAHHVGVGVGIT